MIEIYTDGSCYPNPGGVGGWAYCLIEDGILLFKEFGKDYNTTNNRMETMACIEALRYCKRYNIVNPIVYSDSRLIVNYSSKGRGKKNRDLINQLVALNKSVRATFKWVKAHSGIKWNEYVDSLASYKAV